MYSNTNIPVSFFGPTIIKNIDNVTCTYIQNDMYMHATVPAVTICQLCFFTVVAIHIECTLLQHIILNNQDECVYLQH